MSAIDNNLVQSSTKSLRRTLFIAAAIIMVFSIVIEFIVRKFSMTKAINAERALERLKVEQEQRERLEEAKEKAEEANKSKSTFLFNMSHDIRTPMNAIVGFTNMALKNLDDKELVKDSLQKTQRSSDLLLSLINDILEVSRLESGKHNLVLEKTNIHKSFFNVDSVLSELATAKDIALSFEIKDIRDPYINIDKTRFNRIILNLGSNAIKYTQNGGVVQISASQLTQEEGDTRYYEFVVEDNGTGMSDEFQKHMFEDFAREVTTTKSGIQGTGLGLSVTKAFVDIMGGTIDCVSKQNVGTKFTVVLPLKICSPEEIESENETISSNEFGKLKGKRVLLVEDNELNRQIATYLLVNEAGLVVETAEDGTFAVDLMKKNGPDFVDFILMDIQMPYMNGYDATKAIRNMYPNKHIPIIALSANAFAEDKQKSIEVGMDDHVEKPIVLEKLLASMLRLYKK